MRLDADTTALIVFASDGGRLCTGGGLSATFAAELTPAPGSDTLRQGYDRDSDGAVIVYHKGPATTSHTVRFRATDYEAGRYRVFRDTASRGTRNKFLWLDARGAAHTVRFAAPSFTVPKLGYDRHEVETTLEEDA